jgi:group I intron endonuclease
MIGIYKITNPKGRIYIGQSIDIQKRFRTYISLNSKTKRQIKLYRSLLKYGQHEHSFEIIEECNIELLNERERYWQDFHKVLENGLNCVLTKTNVLRMVVSDEKREKARQQMLGKKPSAINIEKTRKRMIGNSYNLGRLRSDDEKKKISNTMKKISIGENNNMFGRLGQDNPNSKIILNTQTGIFYFGISEASKYGGINKSTLKKKICGNRYNNTYFIYV